MSQSSTIQFTRRTTTDYIAVHCAATSTTQDIGRKEIDEWHRQRGFLCIGYHYVIRRDGAIEVGRDEGAIGAHVQDYNHNSLGICMVGGSRFVRVGQDSQTHLVEQEENNFTPAQWVTLEKLLRHLKEEYPSVTIQGHRDFPDVKKYCPSFNVKPWVAEKGI